MAGRRHRRLRLSRAAGGTAAGMVLAVTAACGGHAPAPHPSASSRPGGLQGESAGQVLQQVKAAAAGLHSVRISVASTGRAGRAWVGSLRRQRARPHHWPARR